MNIVTVTRIGLEESGIQNVLHDTQLNDPACIYFDLILYEWLDLDWHS